MRSALRGDDHVTAGVFTLDRVTTPSMSVHRIMNDLAVGRRHGLQGTLFARLDGVLRYLLGETLQSRHSTLPVTGYVYQDAGRSRPGTGAARRCESPLATQPRWPHVAR